MIRSEMWRTTARSCAMKRYVRPKSPCSDSSRLMICAWIETSSAETGSSQTRKSGLSASARARPMRCRCPPENSCGYRLAASTGSPTTPRSSRTAQVELLPGGDLVRAQRLADDATDRMPRIERRVRILEDHLHLPAHRVQLVLGRLGDVLAVERDSPARSACTAGGSRGRASTCRSPTRPPARPSRRARSRRSRRRPPSRLPRGGRARARS